MKPQNKNQKQPPNQTPSNNRKTIIIAVVVSVVIAGLLLGSLFMLARNYIEKRNEALRMKELNDKRIEEISKNLEEAEAGVKSKLVSRKKMPTEEIKKYDLEKISRESGVRDQDATDKYIEEEMPAETGEELGEGQISYYQSFVTPSDSAIAPLAQGKSCQEVYQESWKWMWIDDLILNGVEDKWFKPNYFLTETPRVLTNPAMGTIASDCESQAHTLASALRACGMLAEDVRVVVGLVDFGTPGGHAWVEVYDQELGGWFQLEATSGKYYDEYSKEVRDGTPIPYDYFQTYDYPSLKKWVMYNDEYFFDVTRGQGKTPKKWLDSDTVKKQRNPDELEYDLPEGNQEIRKEETEKSQDELKNELEKLPYFPKQSEEDGTEEPEEMKLFEKCAASSALPKLKTTTKYGIFGDDEFDTAVCGYLVTKSEEVWGNMQTNAYFRMLEYADAGFKKSLLDGIASGNGVNAKSGSYVDFNLGCYGNGKISGATITAADQNTLINSSQAKPVVLILSFTKHPGYGCTCCSLAERARVLE